MKTLIKTSALAFVLGLFSTGVFAASKIPAVNDGPDAVLITESASNDCAVNVSLGKAASGNTMVTIYDNSESIILKESLSNDDKIVRKGYDFSGLEDGDYTIAVSSNNEVVKKTVHVYSDENDQKSTLAE